MTNELIVRLTRLEERMQHVVTAVEHLARRDAEFDDALRAMSDRFNTAISAQADVFRENLAAAGTVNPAIRGEPVFNKRPLTMFLRQLFAYG